MKTIYYLITSLFVIVNCSCGNSKTIELDKQSITIDNDSIKDYSIVIRNTSQGKPLTHILRVEDFKWQDYFKRNVSMLYCENGKILCGKVRIDSVVMEGLQDSGFDGYLFVIDYTFQEPFSKSQIKDLEHFNHLKTYSYLKNDNLFTFFAYEYNLKNDK